MLNAYPKWKYILLSVVFIIGVLYALPNVFGDDPAIQIIGQNGAGNAAIEEKIEIALHDASLNYRIERHADQWLLRFVDTNAQLQARDLLRTALGPGYIVALNLAPATPAWLSAIGAKPMKLGLDLRGGVHFLIAVDVETALQHQQERLSEEIREVLRAAKCHYTRVARIEGGDILVDVNDRDKASQAVRQAFPELEIMRDEAHPTWLMVRMSLHAMQEIRLHTVEHTIATLRNRVNELGVAEAVVQRQGLDRIVVELPGIQETARAKDILGKTATLSFHLRDESHDATVVSRGAAPAGTILRYDRRGEPVLLRKMALLTGDSVTGATAGADSRDGRPVVNVRIGGEGVTLFKKVTRENVGKQMAVLYSETQHIPNPQGGGEQRQVSEQIISLATIQSALGTQFQISGLTRKEAQDLSLLLRAGALPAAVSIIEERTVGPSLGQENIQAGLQSIYVGMALVLIFMAVYYSIFGIIANLALLINLVLLVAVLSILGATLTLPGIAGIVLTMGMAVDANVLIFERIREELRNGVSPQGCIHYGFERAMATILDANLTTLLVGVILFSIGLGPVRGFAITLNIGILTSVLTAVTGTRVMLYTLYGGAVKRTLRIGI